MCGIVGYVGRGAAPEILLNGLHRLEYRGYDSAGIAVLHGGNLQVCRAVGKVKNLEAKALGSDGLPRDAHTGIAHTRWATHGSPTEANAHPHCDDHAVFACVHNGIIENHQHLREQLRRKGHTFHSETDTEVIPHLIAEFYNGDFLAAAAAALRQLQGAFGVALLCRHHPDQIVAARKGSPIVLGVGNGESIVASDVAAVLGHTNNVIFLDDGDLALVTPGDVSIRNLDNVPITRDVSRIDWTLESVEKGGFDHFMLKEIHDQPESLRNALRGRLDADQGTAILSGMNMTPHDLVDIDRIVIAACGTSLHAGMVGEHLFEDLAGIVTEVEQAAEFRYRNPILSSRTLAIAISQSGETADTLAALREAKMKGSQVLAICNVVSSTIAREAGRGVYLHAGPEISVASTKAFTSQVVILLLMALKFARTRRMPRQTGVELVEELRRLPDQVARVLDRAPEIERIARKWAAARDFFYIGRGYLHPVALEGALKLKEISYIHAEGYHAAELKHGPIALLDEDVPVVTLANDIDGKDKMLSNIQECRARHAPVILTATEGDTDVAGFTEDVIRIPRTHQCLTPVTTTVALQLFAYYVARERGCPIDQPRNLAKSVTVE
ncbi:MAG: glutamine--fructose-6-phosphate aminotransferase [Lentisphaerae bacterium RIFOXYB12_FULL_65_16]|nr:MAG: glutamine--fructose-6-phosphate aminotransferase [Lentisphaerae bacterium RIFOXYB12_FULL_65_16]